MNQTHKSDCIVLKNVTLSYQKTVIPYLPLYYTIYGNINTNKDNVIWVFHAFTGSSYVADWWQGMFSNEGFFDLEKYCVLCFNMPGSCYGSFSPIADNNNPVFQGLQFPKLSIKDIAHIFIKGLEHLHIPKVHLGIGGSMGGQVLLECMIHKPNIFHKACLIASNAKHSPWSIGINHTQRTAIEMDMSFGDNDITAGRDGMQLARSIAMLTYRSHRCFNLFQDGKMSKEVDTFKSISYLNHHGKKLQQRFNAYSYYYLTLSMDSHNISSNGTSVEATLKCVTSPVLILSMTDDVLFPIEEQAFMATHIPNAQHHIIDTVYGHDGFLIHHDIISGLIKKWI